MSLPHVNGWFDAVMLSITAGLVTVLSFLPAIIGAIIVLVVGWVLSGFIGGLITMFLDRIGFERAARRTGISDFVARSGARDARVSRIIGELVKWFIRLLFLEAAAEAVHLTAVTAVLNAIVLFIPNVIVAVVVIMLGALIARFVGDVVRGSAGEMGFASPNLLAAIARTAIMAFAVIVAVNQIGIAATIVNTLFMGVVLALALAAGLAFGLGGRDTAARMWQGWYQRGQELAPRLEQAAEASAVAAQEPAPETGRQVAPERTRPEDAPRGSRYRISPE